MMTVITGVPGSGKTAYCVEKLLLPIAGKPEKAIDSDGNQVEIVRKIWTNINGLLIDHEKIDETHLNTWHEWAKPGDLIVYDEVQKPWPLKATGSTKPKHIEALETHRHMGVDFIFMTQHPMLIETSVVRLGGRHLHVRRLGNSRFATVYEWDGVSRTLLYKNSLSKAAWRRSKKTEQSYRSAALHTTQKRKVPALLYGVAFGVLGFLALSPSTFARLGERINPTPVALQPAKQAASAASASVRPTPSGPRLAASEAVSVPMAAASAPAVLAYAGCVSMRGVCKCYASDGMQVDKPHDFCSTLVGNDRGEKLAVLPGSLLEHQSPRAPGRWIGFSEPPKPQYLTIGDVVATYHKP